MLIQLPNLGDVTFDELMREMTTAIPKYTREWTNFNPSDPGITLLELFAWIAEGLIYQCNRLPDQVLIDFLELVVGSSLEVKYDPQREALWQYLEECKADQYKGISLDVTEMKAQTQAFLNSGYRAVTAADFKRLALEAIQTLNRDATYPGPRVEVFSAAYGIEVVVILKPEFPEPERLIDRVEKYLAPRRLVGAFCTVSLPLYSAIELWIVFDYKAYTAYQTDQVKAEVDNRVRNYLDPLGGGPDGTGWPYAKSLNKYELIHVIEKVAGVANVVSVACNGNYGWESYRVEGLINLVDLVLELGWEVTPQ